MKKWIAGFCSLALLAGTVCTTEAATHKKHRHSSSVRTKKRAPLQNQNKSEIRQDSTQNTQILPPPPPSSGFDKFETVWKKGLQFKSKDEKYSLQFRINVQPRYEYNALEGKEDQNTFRVRRLKLSWSGNAFTKKLDYKVQVNFINSKAEDILEDAYISYAFNPAFKVLVGQTKVSFNRQQINGDEKLEFVDRSLAADEFRFSSHDSSVQTTCTFASGEQVSGVGVICGPGVPSTNKTLLAEKKFSRDIGIVLHGEPFNKKLEYRLGITNGSGINRINGNKAFLYAGRVTWNVLGQYGYSEGDVDTSEKPILAISANAGFNDEDLTKKKVLMAGGDVGFRYKRFAAQGEYFFRNNNPTGPANSTRDHGYYAQAGYFVIPKRLEVAARASQVFLDGPSNNKGEFMGAVGYYIFGHDLKIQGDYAYLPQQTPKGTLDNHRFRLQLQAWF